MKDRRQVIATMRDELRRHLRPLFRVIDQLHHRLDLLPHLIIGDAEYSDSCG
jgi:hypothetical protein